MKYILLAVSLTLAAAAGGASAQPAEAKAAGPGDVAYWITTYAGEDLTSGKFDCKAPVLPAFSKTNEEINAANKAINDWSACYNGVVANLSANRPLFKRVPADVAAKMNSADLEQANRHLDEVYGKVVASVQASATAAIAQQDAWRAATQKYVHEQNLAMAKRVEEENRVMVEQQRKMTDSTVRPITGVR